MYGCISSIHIGILILAWKTLEKGPPITSMRVIWGNEEIFLQGFIVILKHYYKILKEMFPRILIQIFNHTLAKLLKTKSTLYNAFCLLLVIKINRNEKHFFKIFANILQIQNFWNSSKTCFLRTGTIYSAN